MAPMTAGPLFLSYSHVDLEFAIRIIGALRGRGVNVWFASDRVHTGDNWVDVMANELARSSGLIALLSPAYLNSRYCLDEFHACYRWNRPIFPVQIAPLADNPLPAMIDALHRINLAGAHLDAAAYDSGIAQLVRDIGVRAREQVARHVDAERRYLYELIAELEARLGVREYVELTADDVTRIDRPAPLDEWAYSLLVEGPSDRASESERSFSTVADVAAHYPRFALVGDPGSGKTTTLRRLARDSAKRRLEGGRDAPLPIMCSLAQCTTSTLEEHLLSRLPRELRDGELPSDDCIAVFVDGFNEATIERAREMMSAYMAAHKPRYLVVASRSLDDHDLSRILEAPVVRIQPLSDPQIEQFVNSHIGGRAAANRLLESLRRPTGASKQQAPLLDLARNPYYLYALMLVFRRSPDFAMPRTLAELFRRLARVLWTREQLLRGATAMPDFSAVADRYSHLACMMLLETGSITSIARKQVEALPDGVRLVEWGLAASYLEVNSYWVSFRHQLLQEYFASLRLAKGLMPAQLKEPTYRYLSYKSGADTYAYSSREGTRLDSVLVDICAVMEDPAPLVRSILEVDPVLAAKCVVAAPATDEGTRSSVMQALVTMVTSSDWRKQVAAALEGFGALKHERAVASMSALVAGESSLSPLRADEHDTRSNEVEPAKPPIGTRAMAAVALGSIGSVAGMPALLEALDDTSPIVRSRAARGLGLVADARAVSRMVAALDDRDPDSHVWFEFQTTTRAEAKLALARMGRRLPQTVISALWAAFGTVDVAKRVDIVEVLGATRLAEAVPCLRLALRDDDERVCRMALNSLAEIGRDESVEVLLQCQHDWRGWVVDAVPACLVRSGVRGVKELVDRLDLSDEQQMNVLKGAAPYATGAECFDMLAPLMMQRHDSLSQAPPRWWSQTSGHPGWLPEPVVRCEGFSYVAATLDNQGLVPR